MSPWSPGRFRGLMWTPCKPLDAKARELDERFSVAFAAGDPEAYELAERMQHSDDAVFARADRGARLIHRIHAVTGTRGRRESAACFRDAMRALEAKP